MSSKEKLISVHTTGNGKNYFELKKNGKIEFQKQLNLELRNHEGIVTNSFDKIKRNDENNRAKIFLRFGLRKDSDLYQITSKDEINYYFINPNVAKDSPEFKQAKLQAELKYLEDNDLIKQDFTHGDIIYSLEIIDGKPELVLKDKNNLTGESKRIKDEQIEINFDFWEIVKTNLENEWSYTGPEKPEEKSPFWTTTKIIIVITALVIGVLIWAFRKKILRWIKGETKQEKKVREQIDIF